jgi:predicted ATPase
MRPVVAATSPGSCRSCVRASPSPRPPWSTTRDGTTPALPRRRDIVRRVAATGPVALLVDDLHWAEPSGLELLRQLVADLAGLPVLIVGAFRDTGDARGEHLRTTVTDLARSGAIHVPLRGMDADELVDLVRTRVDGAAGHDVGDVVELLEAETAGNPLFAEHLLRFWSESHRLGLDDTTMTLGPASSGPLPATLRDLVWQRVGVLGPESRAVLSAAAVLGVEFDESALGAMVQIDADTSATCWIAPPPLV